jgi:hypothetical protein
VKDRSPLVVIATLVAFIVLGKFVLVPILSYWNREDCEEAGQRLHGKSTLVSMPDGVRDVCMVQTEAGTTPVQMR